MENPVSPLSAPDARAAQPLLAPRPVACTCGALLELEMERDEGLCVDCAFYAAVAFYRS